MAGKTSKATTQPPGEALSPKHEAFVQAYVSRGMNGTKAYRAAYPGCKSDEVARAAAARLLANVSIRARVLRGVRGRGQPRPAGARQVLQSRVLVLDSATLPPEARLAVASSERRTRRSP
jgi:hypothetical protein